MPEFNEIIPKHPILINSIGDFRLDNPISVDVDVFPLTPDADKRGAAYMEDTDFAETVVLLRGQTSIHQSADQALTTFPSGGQSALGSLNTGYSITNINTVHNILGSFWVLGQNQLGGGSIHAKQNGGTLRSTSSWTAYDTDSPWTTASSAYFLRRDVDGNLYCLMHRTTAPFSIVVMKRTGSSNFVNVTTSGVTSSTPPTAYEVSFDGLVHMMAYGNTEARSLDGGATWTTVNATIDGCTEISHSQVYNTWVMSAASGASNPGCVYSTNNGTSWTNARIRGASIGDTTITRFSHIEKVDPEGRFLLALRGFSPIRVYVSWDGGKSWLFSQTLTVPNYGPDPELGRVILVHTGSKILIYMGSVTGGYPSWNHDNSMFASGLIGFASTTF